MSGVRSMLPSASSLDRGRTGIEYRGSTTPFVCSSELDLLIPEVVIESRNIERAGKASLESDLARSGSCPPARFMRIPPGKTREVHTALAITTRILSVQHELIGRIVLEPQQPGGLCALGPGVLVSVAEVCREIAPQHTAREVIDGFRGPALGVVIGVTKPGIQAPLVCQVVAALGIYRLVLIGYAAGSPYAATDSERHGSGEAPSCTYNAAARRSLQRQSLISFDTTVDRSQLIIAGFCEP